jgi:hypothetical protein
MTAGTPGPHSAVNTPEALDGELRTTLGEIPVPRLSTGFEARLAARIARDQGVPERPTPTRWPGKLLPVYWLIAAGAAHRILAEIEWTTLPGPGVWCLAAAALSLVVPCIVLAWQARIGLR